MKKIILLFNVLFIGMGLQAQTFFDDFESYNTGKLGPQSTDWTTWSGLDGGTDDVNVVATDNHTAGGSKSIYFISTSTSGGPSDVILPFPGAPLKTGKFSFSAWFKVEAGKSAYFNFQANKIVGQIWALDCQMRATGEISFENSTSGVFLTSTYPQNEWFELTIDVNLNTSIWEPSINGTSLGTFSNSNSISSIDLFPLNGSKFWVDDVSYEITPYVLPERNAAVNGISVPNGLVGQTRNATVRVRNIGVSPITSFDVTLEQNQGTPDTISISGINLASLATYDVNFDEPLILETGANSFRAIVSNVNGEGADGDVLDDTITTIVTPVRPAPGKIVVLEEGTGTWCQWCPRGAVFMDLMAEKYHGYVAPIAVHNFDPMTVEEYDSNIGFTAYPNARVDRSALEVDPSGIESPFLNRISDDPLVTIVNGASYDSITRELKVSLTTTVLGDILGNFTIACVITEDSVRGNTSDYSQANAYAGGGNGPMGGYESLPNPVPAAQMNYNHVARAISPSFDGYPYTNGEVPDSGQILNHILSYSVPEEWDVNQLHIIGLFLNPSGAINNASNTTLAEAIANGFDSTGVEITTAFHEIPQVDAQIDLYPNPASDEAIVSLNLKRESNVQLAVYQVNGTLLARKDYGRLSGGIFLPVNINHFEPGMYFVHVTIDGIPAVMKLIKQ